MYIDPGLATVENSKRNARMTSLKNSAKYAFDQCMNYMSQYWNDWLLLKHAALSVKSLLLVIMEVAFEDLENNFEFQDGTNSVRFEPQNRKFLAFSSDRQAIMILYLDLSPFAQDLHLLSQKREPSLNHDELANRMIRELLKIISS